jgi:HPt (histidine-containing phosphotransfer) domain-containing protein
MTDFIYVCGTMSQYSGFDLKIFERLREDTDENVALRILTRFTVTLNECLQEIKSCQNDSDPERIWKALHKIAGSAELIGLSKLGQESRHLSYLIRNMSDFSVNESDLEDYLENAEKASKYLSGITQRLKAYL